MRLIDADPFGVIFLQGKSEEFIEGVNFILDKIYEAPTVIIPVAELDTTEDSGEWIDRSDGGRIIYPFWERYECSKCGAKSENTNFCPNCGASMRVKDELNRVSKELNSEIENSKSEIVPDYRDGWRLRGEAE